ncbi:MAG: Gfo/Idh/MocA family oxidoreductase [Bryobacterales bacterium]|nr:Gfo/Idh/MocA family oxidoreductase [Bryobacterales bacterium]
MRRRHFLSLSGATLAASAAARAAKVGPNDRIRIGFIGLGGRARWLLANEQFPGAEIVSVADCFLPRCDEAARTRPEGEKWRKYHDYRAMFDAEKLDAVFVETTTHARALIALHAMQAGLDVYAEKPLTLTVAEGRILVKAARRLGRILTTGTQQRSIPANVYASKLVREGAIGRVREVMVCNFEAGKHWTPRDAEPMPEGLNWDQWCNQTELRPYHSELQKRWSWYTAYDGGGQSWGVTGWGAHSLDQVQCALGTDNTCPVEIVPDAPGETAKVTMRYASGVTLKLWGARRDHADLGAIFTGDKGVIEIKRGSFTVEPAGLAESLLKDAPEFTPEGPGENRFHIANFFDAIRSRQLPNADVEIGHRSSTVCHLVNIARDLGRKLKYNPDSETFRGDAEANAKLTRPRRKGYELPRIG